MLLDPSKLHIEISSRCVLKCPRCPRTELDLDYLNQEIDLETFQRVFPVDTLRLIKKILFCGHTGDPIYANSLLPVVGYIKENSSIEITITTNGSYRKTEFWQELGSMLTKDDMIVFSVDGWDQPSNNLYRANSDFGSITDGIRSLRESSDCKIQWSSIYFKFNQDQIKHMKDLAQRLGCDFFECVRSSKFDGRYQIDGIDGLKPSEDLVASTLRYEREIKFLTGKEPPTIMLVNRHKHPWARCANHLKELFLDVRGLLLPCAWFTGDYQPNAFLDRYHDRLSIYNRSFLEILQDRELWAALESSWHNDPMPICRLKCKNG